MNSEHDLFNRVDPRLGEKCSEGHCTYTLYSNTVELMVLGAAASK